MLVRRAIVSVVVGAATAIGGAAAVSSPAAATAPAPTTSYTAVAPTGRITLATKGNGHGHGMSQYGARGAARLGRTYRQILAFYYPHTTLTTLRPSWIRVKISGHGSTAVVAAERYLTVTGVPGYLPIAGVRRYRLVADARGGLTLQQLRLAPGSTWRTYRTGLRDGAWFRRGALPTRLYTPTGASNAYYGVLRAFRITPTGPPGGVLIVNAVALDDYTAGVAAREMPAAWEHAATQTQAVAARSYGRYAIVHPSTPQWNICDTNRCQVYKGHLIYDGRGRLVARDNRDAIRGDANQVLEYQGAPIFAQFDASNGGWAVDGGKPYLTAHTDPYDTSGAARNPWTLRTVVVTTASVARWFDLARVTGIGITRRDGHGTWGGRVLDGYVRGVNAAGRAVTVPTTGAALSMAFDVHTRWLRVVA